jgi:threonine dehydratase
MDTISLQLINQASARLQSVIKSTPLEFNERLSKKYNANIYFKREDLQVVRSFKIRGAYNLISSLNTEQRYKGVVCASAGNHAQGVALSCAILKVQGVIFMPSVTPKQKIAKVKKFGGEYIEVRLEGNTFDEASTLAQEYCQKNGMIFVHAFNDSITIAGQGTIGKEILEQKPDTDYVICAIGGGGLIGGIGSYVTQVNPNIKVIGCEPTGAASMNASFEANKVVKLDKMDTFCEAVAVQTVGSLSFKIAKNVVNKICVIPEGHVCTDMIDLYQIEGIIVEPAGALPVSCLEYLKNEIQGKTVVCVICGGNNDISRYPEVIERSLIWQGRKHYFILELNQKPGEIRKLVSEVLGANDDIVLFEYVKKNNKEKGVNLVGIELANKDDLQQLLIRLNASGIKYKEITSDDSIYSLLV